MLTALVNFPPKDKLMRNLARVALVIGVIVSAATVSDRWLLADEGANVNSTKPELLPIVIRVTTADDEPIEGAVVRVYGLRTRAERASHYGWNPKSHGLNEDLFSDAEGKVEIWYPKYVTERLETGEISLLVDHEEFKSVTQDSPVDKGPIVVRMTRGRRYSLHAINGTTDDLIVKNLFCELSGGAGTNEWRLLDDGTLRSRAVALERDFLRVIFLPDDGPAMFSSPLFLGNQPELIRDCHLPNIRVEPGRHIHGILDDTVPRPIKNGHVVLKAVNTISRKDADSRLAWNDWAPIDAEGKFHFDSVPRDSIVMIVAVCDGYLSSAAIPEELEAAGIEGEDAAAFQSASMILPLVIRLKDDLDNWTVPMLPTATCRVTVQDSEGSPLPGADVYSNPNQMFPGIGSNIVGDGHSSAKIYKLSVEEQKRLFLFQSRDEMRKLGVRIDFRNAYSRKTDENGVAVLHTLPGGQSLTHKEHISVEHPEYEIPTSPEQPVHRVAQVELLAEETAEITIRMQSKGTDSIGRK